MNMCLGYFLGELLGGHVRAVFTLITIIFIICVSFTLTSFREMPLSLLELRSGGGNGAHFEHFRNDDEDDPLAENELNRNNYGAVEQGSSEQIPMVSTKIVFLRLTILMYPFLRSAFLLENDFRTTSWSL